MRVTRVWTSTVLVAALAMLVGAAQAAPITAITGSPAISNPVDVETTLTSITTDNGTLATIRRLCPCTLLNWLAWTTRTFCTTTCWKPSRPLTSSRRVTYQKNTQTAVR